MDQLTQTKSTKLIKYKYIKAKLSQNQPSVQVQVVEVENVGFEVVDVEFFDIEVVEVEDEVEAQVEDENEVVKLNETKFN